MYKTNEQLKKQIKQACLATYVFASEIMTERGLEGTIWCGKGTITAVSSEL